MPKFKFNKLCRDKVIDRVMEQSPGSKISSHRLNDAEFNEQIRIKLLEEAQEVAVAKDRQELVSELADLHEVIDALTQIHQISKSEIAEIQAKKRDKRGGFEGRLFVEIAEHPVGSWGEKYCLADPKKYPEVVEK